MPITTKKGDKGRTDLYFGGRVNKDDLRVGVYGTVDELCSFLGFSKSLVKEKKLKIILESIQRDLFLIGGEIATKSHYLHKLEQRIDKSRIKWLEEIIKEYEKKANFKECCFYISGENSASASLDIARTVCRRAERLVVSFNRKGMLRNKYILIYLNRLSDLLYLMERSFEKKYVRV